VDEPGAAEEGCADAAQEALVREFLREVSEATPWELVRYAVGLQALTTRRDLHRSPVTLEAVAEALRRLRQVLETEP